MKVKSTCTLSFLVFLIFLFPIHAFAVVWDISDDDLKKVAFELKKFNTHLENLKNTQIKSLQGQQEDLLRQIEEIKQILPQLLGTIDQNKQEILISIGRTNSKMADLEAEVKNQVLDEIHQQNKILQLFRQEQANLKEGLAQDMEKFEQNIGSIKAVLTTDLIPALRNENNKTRQSMLGEIEKLKFFQNRLEGKLDELLRKMGFEKLESWDIYK